MPIDHTWYVRPKGVRAERLAAGGVVVRAVEDRVFVALARERGKPGGFLPKGGIEGNETLDLAARREIVEEAGFTNLFLLDNLGVRSRLNFPKTRWSTTHYFLYYTDQVAGKPGEPDRHARPIWRDLNDLNDIFWPEQREIIQTHHDRIHQRIREMRRFR